MFGLKKHKYNMCKPQKVQLDCRVTDCKFYASGGNCTNEAPAITLINDNFTCWSKKEWSCTKVNSNPKP